MPLLVCAASLAQPPSETHTLHIEINHSDGSYSIGMPGSGASAFTSGVAAEVNGRWLKAADYPQHRVQESNVSGYFGPATDWRVICSGLTHQPDLIYDLRIYQNRPLADIQVRAHNTTGKKIYVEAIRSVDATGKLNLDGPNLKDRVLSDSFSEDRPAMQLHDFADAPIHLAVGSQLIYNRQSRESLFLGALTSNRFLTILRLRLDKNHHFSSYQVDSTGTTEMEKENSLRHSPAEDQIQLEFPIDPGASISSEQMLIELSEDYHKQLETYGSLIRKIHHARVSAPPLMGWWSWTAYYFGLNAGMALTNAEWEAEHLKSFGYNLFHIDEGYQYARGEYITPNATMFPHGVAPVEYKVHGLGLTPGIWTAPFEISARSWVYQHHRDWLVKNAKGQPIPLGHVSNQKDQLYALDTTNPGAQQSLRKTYSTLVNEWGIRYIKLDFMDDSSIEGYHYKPNTTALQAQRIGLKIIRQTVGNSVYLDKDGSPMLNPVGLVDYGRISQDTGHSFEASKSAAPGIAARYYMNRNFFVDDPDAFTVSKQTIPDQSWHNRKAPETLNDAEVSIVLAAVSGGMFEIGDNLPSLMHSPKRLGLIENRDLIDMVRLGHASVPVDLMSYSPEDQQPSIFFLKESKRQSILTIFNWTDGEREHTIKLSTLGLPATAKYAVTDVFNKSVLPVHSGVLTIRQPRHSVRVLKIVDTDIKQAAPAVEIVDQPSSATTSATTKFSARSEDSRPILSYLWDFGDGVKQKGPEVSHAYTEPGDYDVKLTSVGLSGLEAKKNFHVHVSGSISTRFNPQEIKRYR
ncbi:MAG: PKD domain-containing protein [Bryobacteraceae bacterium]